MSDRKIFGTMETAGIYREFSSLDNYGEFAEGLTRIAMSHGAGFTEGLKLADSVIRSVAQYEAANEDVREDARQAMQKLYAELDEVAPAKRLAILNQMYFGLKVCSDDVLFGRLCEVGGEALYRENCGELSYSPALEAELKRKILRRVSSLSFSPRALERMTKALLRGGDVTASAAALGRDGFTLKCVAAMHFYMSNRDSVSVEQASLAACSGTDIQALGDAVNAGRIGSGAALALMAAGLIALTIVSAKAIIAAASLGGGLLILGVSTLLLGGFCSALQDLPARCGEAAVVCRGLVLGGAQSIGRGFERAAAYLKARLTATYGDDEHYYSRYDDEDSVSFQNYYI